MNFLLDTNILIYCLQKQAGNVFHDFVFQLSERGSCFISTINRFELLAGTLDCYKKQNQEFLNFFPLITLNQEIADRAAELFQEYKRQGITLHNEDVFLASTALLEDLWIVTTNAKHFPSFQIKEKHAISFISKKSIKETKLVFILAPLSSHH